VLAPGLHELQPAFGNLVRVDPDVVVVGPGEPGDGLPAVGGVVLAAGAGLLRPHPSRRVHLGEGPLQPSGQQRRLRSFGGVQEAVEPVFAVRVERQGRRPVA
jgi:hypothetical protein